MWTGPSAPPRAIAPSAAGRRSSRRATCATTTRSRRCSTRRCDEFGRVDILVNNAGITEPQPLLEMTLDEWDKTLNINLRGMFLCTQRAAREMIKQGAGGRIVNLSSVHGYGAVPNHAHYEASKGGINMFTKACAIELAPHNIQVNAIAPGAIEVARYFDIPGYDREEWGAAHPGRARRLAGRHRAAGGVSVLARRELHHRPDHLGRRRHDQSTGRHRCQYLSSGHVLLD